MPSPVVLTADDEPLRPPGLKALRQEREAREAAERALRDLTARIVAIEERPPVNMPQLLTAISEIRSEVTADVHRLRQELQEVSEALEQLQAMVRDQQ